MTDKVECTKCGHNDGTYFTGRCVTEGCCCHCEFPPDPQVDVTAPDQINPARSNHFTNEAIDAGTFPSHISTDSRAYYSNHKPTAADSGDAAQVLPSEQAGEGEYWNPTPGSSKAWREWFDCAGNKATADLVNATAILVVAERGIARASQPQATRSRCTCNHVCPPRIEFEIDEDTHCVHAPDCELIKSAAHPVEQGEDEVCKALAELL